MGYLDFSPIVLTEQENRDFDHHLATAFEPLYDIPRNRQRYAYIGRQFAQLGKTKGR